METIGSTKFLHSGTGIESNEIPTDAEKKRLKINFRCIKLL